MGQIVIPGQSAVKKAAFGVINANGTLNNTFQSQGLGTIGHLDVGLYNIANTASFIARPSAFVTPLGSGVAGFFALVNSGLGTTDIAVQMLDHTSAQADAAFFIFIVGF